MSLPEPAPAGLLAAATRHRLVRFLLVGSVNTGVDLLVYVLLVSMTVPLVLANLVSTSCGLLVSYLLNRAYVFGGGGGSRLVRLRRVALFVITTGIGLWVLQPVVIVIVTGLLRPSQLPSPLLVLLPKLAATAVTLCWNYASYGLVVFARRPVVGASDAPARG